MAKGLSGATTVAATAHLAAKAGVKVFATGGLGGVHRGASESFDESADLTTLASSPVVVVSAGVKSVLDIGATLERLETLSIPVSAALDQGSRSALVVANPVPADEAWEVSEHDAVLEQAFAAAQAAGVRGKEVTPFLLQFIVEASGGKSLDVNLSLARNNVSVAGEIARALAI